jgi:hypothetical protein
LEPNLSGSQRKRKKVAFGTKEGNDKYLEIKD